MDHTCERDGKMYNSVQLVYTNKRSQILDCLIAIYKANLLVNFVEIPDYLKLEIQGELR
jgi:hypothetical protein